MDNEEFNKLCDEMRAQGATDEDILNALYDMFIDGKIESKEDLGKLAGALGYKLSDKFLNEDAPIPAEVMKQLDEVEHDGDKKDELSEEEIEDAKVIDKGEEKEDNKSDESDKDEKSDDKDDKEDEEKERKEAHKMFGLDD